MSARKWPGKASMDKDADEMLEAVALALKGRTGMTAAEKERANKLGEKMTAKRATRKSGKPA